MSKKSANRRARDAEKAKLNGGKMPSARVVREKTTRSWYELKNVHARSVNYIMELAERMKQYANPLVLMKIDKNGDTEKWKELNKELQSKAATTGVELAALYDLHKDKKKLCLSQKELEEAFRIFEAYQAFDTDFFLNFPPIINALNEIFNKALKQLLDAKDDLAKNMVDDAAAKMIDPTVVSDVNYTEVTTNDTPLPAAVGALDLPGVAAAFNAVVEQPSSIETDIATLGYEVTKVSANPHNRESFTKDLAKAVHDHHDHVSHTGEERSVPEPGTPSEHDFPHSPGGPKFPRGSFGGTMTIVEETPSTQETGASAEEFDVDPNMHYGLIRPKM